MDSLHVDDKKKVCYLPEVLTGPMAVALHNTKVREGMTFAEVRAKLMSAAGLTVSHARKLFFRPDVETLVKMSGVDVVHHVCSLITRILTGGNYCDEVLKSLLVGFFSNVGTAKLVMSLNDAATDTVDDVIDIIHRSYENYGCVISTDFRYGVPVENSRKEFGHYGRYKPTCENCGKYGHRSADCWFSPGRANKGVTCFACQQTGHVSSNCPNKNSSSANEKSEKVKEKMMYKKTNANVVTVKEEDAIHNNRIKVAVGNAKVDAILDSGAEMSVVPSKYVPEVCYTGNVVDLTDFEHLLDRKRRVANVCIAVGSVSWYEKVAVSDHLGDRALLKIDLNNKERTDLLLGEFYGQRDRNSINAVMTRAQRKDEIEKEEREQSMLEEEKIVLKGVGDGNGEWNHMGMADEIFDSLVK